MSVWEASVAVVLEMDAGEKKKKKKEISERKLLKVVL